MFSWAGSRAGMCFWRLRGGARDPFLLRDDGLALLETGWGPPLGHELCSKM